MTEHTIDIDESNFSEEQRLLVDILVTEGRLRENEEILDMLAAELYTSNGQDLYYDYAVRAIIEKIKERNA